MSLLVGGGGKHGHLSKVCQTLLMGGGGGKHEQELTSMVGLG